MRLARSLDAAAWQKWAETAESADLLPTLDSHLTSRTCLAGHQKTIADSAVAEAVLRRPGWSLAACKASHPHLYRWLRFTAVKPLLQLPDGVPVVLLEDRELCEQHVSKMWDRARAADGVQVIGLDTEWGDGTRTGGSSDVAVLLQLCDNACVLLIRLQQCLPSGSLSALLADSVHTVKSGVAIMGDAALLQDGYGLTTSSCVDLRGPAAVLEIHDSGRNGLQALTRAVLKADLSKDPEIRCGDWTAPSLSDEQITYAALDAVAGRQILVQMLALYVSAGSMEGFVRPFVDIPISFKSSKQSRESGGGRKGVLAKETTAPIRKKQNTLYKHEGMNNWCVVCADTEHLHRVYVVPHCFRTHLPDDYKKGHHDILLLCNKCYRVIEPAASHHRGLLFQRAGIDDKRRRFCNVSKDVLALRNAARILCRHRDSVPAERQRALREQLRHSLGRDASDGDIEAMAAMQAKVEVKEYVSPEQQIVGALLEPGSSTKVDEERYTEFVQGWRRLLVDTLKPRHLPAGWSIEGPSVEFGGPHGSRPRAQRGEQNELAA